MKIWCMRQESLAGGQSFQEKSGHEMDVEARVIHTYDTQARSGAYSPLYRVTKICEDFGRVWGVSFNLVYMAMSK